MRFLVHFQVPNEPFNSYVRDGSAGAKLGRLLEETQPESIYFSEFDGGRGGVAIYNLENSSQIPEVAEPWFLTFNASMKFRVAMTPEDLRNAGLDELGKKWA